MVLLLAVVYMTCRTHSLIPVLSAFYLIAFQQKKESTCKPCKPCTGGNTYLTGAEAMWDSQPRHHRGHCKFLPFLFQSDTEITILAACMMVKHTPAGPLLSPADWITSIEDLEPARNSPSLSQCFRWQRQRCQLWFELTERNLWMEKLQDLWIKWKTRTLHRMSAITVSTENYEELHKSTLFLFTQAH